MAMAVFSEMTFPSAADALCVLEFDTGWRCIHLDEGYRRIFGRDPSCLDAFLQQTAPAGTDVPPGQPRDPAQAQNLSQPLPKDLSQTLAALPSLADGTGRHSFLCDQHLHVLHASRVAGGPVRVSIQIFDVSASLASRQQEDRQQRFDLGILGNLIHENFTEVIVCNLTRNTYRLIKYDMQTMHTVPSQGNLDEFLSHRLEMVATEDRAAYARHFSCKGLIRTFLE